MCAPMSVDWCDAAIYSVYHKPKLQNIFWRILQIKYCEFDKNWFQYSIIQQGQILHDEGRRKVRLEQYRTEQKGKKKSVAPK